MPLTLDDLFASPDHYLHSFDGADAVFVPMDAAAYRRSIFLDDRIQPASETAMRVARDMLIGGDAGAPLPVSWIFHIAHCGSTLLARALGELGDRLVLREPLALRQAAVMRDRAALALVLRMLGKHYPGTGMPVVKANVPVNFVIPDIATAMPGAPAIFLYYGLEDYLLAILRSENHRAWLRRVSSELAPVPDAPAASSDGELAAALWMAQLRMFRTGLDAMPNGRTLDAERFFAHPGTVLASVAELFGIACDAARLEAVASGGLFASYAKNPAVPFDNTDRVARKDALRAALSGELASAERWLVAHAPDRNELTEAIAARSLT